MSKRSGSERGRAGMPSSACQRTLLQDIYRHLEGLDPMVQAEIDPRVGDASRGWSWCMLVEVRSCADLSGMKQEVISWVSDSLEGQGQARGYIGCLVMSPTKTYILVYGPPW